MLDHTVSDDSDPMDHAVLSRGTSRRPTLHVDISAINCAFEAVARTRTNIPPPHFASLALPTLPISAHAIRPNDAQYGTDDYLISAAETSLSDLTVLADDDPEIPMISTTLCTGALHHPTSQADARTVDGFAAAPIGTWQNADPQHASG